MLSIVVVYSALLVIHMVSEGSLQNERNFSFF